MKSKFDLSHLRAAFLSAALGDALGVPVEFLPRARLQQNPVKTMLANGTHGQRAGTWSDDSAMLFCLAAALAEGTGAPGAMANFGAWYEGGFWSARGEVFDIGISTRQVLSAVASGQKAWDAAGRRDEGSNGNGSLMRTLPLAFWLFRTESAVERYAQTAAYSSLTHAHERSCLACFFYVEMSIYLLQGLDKWAAYKAAVEACAPLCSDIERGHWVRLFSLGLQDCAEASIGSSGYVMHTLEAALWVLLRTETLSEALLLAVNLGEDTDTTACVVGGWAGILYGEEALPADWLAVLARKEDIEVLAAGLWERCVY